MIAVIDYGMGNVRSIVNAVEYLGEECVLTSDEAKIRKSSRIILPGVGAFGDSMARLTEKGLPDILRKYVVEGGRPFLGICLGMQLLASTSEEHGTHAGLDWIAADVKRLPCDVVDIKVPHVGWNNIETRGSHPLISNLKVEQMVFYFVHSYYMACKENKNIVAACPYGIEFPAVVVKDNIAATQFHPEKSQDNGLQVLRNFFAWRP